MKRRLALLVSLAALACARADLVIEQKIEGADQAASLSTLKMKGAKLRVDVRNAAGAVSTILDLETGESLTLLHAEKLALKGAPRRRRRPSLRCERERVQEEIWTRRKTWRWGEGKKSASGMRTCSR